MTLSDLLSGDLPSLHELKKLWLVFSSIYAEALDKAQEDQLYHKAKPIILNDGKLALCADLLTEINENGLFSIPFLRLDPSTFSSIEVVNQIISPITESEL